MADARRDHRPNGAAVSSVPGSASTTDGTHAASGAAPARAPRWPSRRRLADDGRVMAMWRQLATTQDLSRAGYVELSRSFATTDDSKVVCMTCGVVSGVGDLRVRNVQPLPPDDGAGADDVPVQTAPAGVDTQVLFDIACPVCNGRGSVVVALRVAT